VAPAAAVYNSRLWLFLTATNDRLYRASFNGLSWSSWLLLPGEGQTQQAPGAVSKGTTMWLFIRSALGEIFRDRYNSSWSGWAEVPGNGSTPSGPRAAVFAKHVWLFVRGSGDGIYYNRY